MASRLDGLDRGSSSPPILRTFGAQDALVGPCYQLHPSSCLLIINIIGTVPFIELPYHRQLALVAAIVQMMPTLGTADALPTKVDWLSLVPSETCRRAFATQYSGATNQSSIIVLLHELRSVNLRPSLLDTLLVPSRQSRSPRCLPQKDLHPAENIAICELPR